MGRRMLWVSGWELRGRIDCTANTTGHANVMPFLYLRRLEETICGVGVVEDEKSVSAVPLTSSCE